MNDLYAPSLYWNLSEEAKDECCNGCGTKGFCGWLVPDTVWLLSVKEACNIHDFMYNQGETLADKEAADRVFLNNMTRLINEKGGIFRSARLRRAKIYYIFVCDFGGPAFWKDKNKPSTLGFDEHFAV